MIFCMGSYYVPKVVVGLMCDEVLSCSSVPRVWYRWKEHFLPSVAVMVRAHLVHRVLNTVKCVCVCVCVCVCHSENSSWKIQSKDVGRVLPQTSWYVVASCFLKKSLSNFELKFFQGTWWGSARMIQRVLWPWLLWVVATVKLFLVFA